MDMGTGTFKDTEGHYYYEKKKKRDRITGSVTTPGTPVTLTGQYYTTGPFIAETVWACNGATECESFQILDGTTALTCDIYLAPGAFCCLECDTPKATNFLNLSPVWMPFFTAVNIDASSADVIVTMGGWIP